MYTSYDIADTMNMEDIAKKKMLLADATTLALLSSQEKKTRVIKCWEVFKSAVKSMRDL